MTFQPSLPYGRKMSGWSGSDTSEAAEPHRRDNQQTAYRILTSVGGQGLTWKELADQTGWHHGTASGVLSAMHKDGKISRLSQRRDRCKVYVANVYVNGRPTEPHGGKAKPPEDPYLAGAVKRLRYVIDHDDRIAVAVRSDDLRHLLDALGH